LWNKDKIPERPKEFEDLLHPEYKNKLVLAYPNDEYAILYAFDLMHVMLFTALIYVLLVNLHVTIFHSTATTG
jgi:hypothetical protein